MARKNRWHPVMLPDDYLRKMKRDMAEVEAQVESRTRYELVLDDRPACDFDQPPQTTTPRPLEGAGIKLEVAGIPPGLPEEPAKMK